MSNDANAVPKNEHQAIGERVGRLLMPMIEEFRLMGVAIGLPPGYRFDPAMDQQARFDYVAEHMTFTLMTEGHLSPEQKSEIHRRVGEHIVKFMEGCVITLHGK